MGYQDNYANNVANIYQNLGNAQAQARLQQGAGWANAFGQIGQLASQIPGQMAQQKKDAQQQELMGINLEVARKNLSDINNRGANATIVSDALKTSMVNGQFNEDVFRAYFTSAGRPELAAPALQEFYDLETSRLANESANFKSQADKDAADAKVFKGIATKIYDSNFSPVELNGYLAYIAKTRPEYGAEVARLLIQATKDPDGFIQTVVTMAKNPAPELKPLTQAPGSQILMPEYDQLNRPTGKYGEPIQGPAEDEGQPVFKEGVVNGQLRILVWDKKTGGFVPTNASPTPGESPSSAQQEDVDSIVDGIISGDLPPQLKGLYRLAGPVQAGLARRGYNLSEAALDWLATNKYLGAANGVKQTTLRQAVETAYHSLDVIEDLSKQWKAGPFQKFNKAELVAAQNGLMGPEAAGIANALMAQIADVTAELGQVYMGGNSPTDHALELAASNLSADWSMETLKKMLDQSRTNLMIRRNSMRSSEPVGTGANPYFSPEQNSTPLPTNRIRYDENGNPITGGGGGL